MGLPAKSALADSAVPLGHRCRRSGELLRGSTSFFLLTVAHMAQITPWK